MASFLAALDPLVTQLLAFQPFVHVVLDSTSGGRRSRVVAVRAAPPDVT